MPIYEYQCRACGKVTDVRHGFDETNSAPCPACGGELARRFSAAGIVFKGSGFYKTDSRAGEAKKSGAKADVAAGDGAKGDAAKTETPKPEKSNASASGGASDSGKADTAAA